MPIDRFAPNSARSIAALLFTALLATAGTAADPGPDVRSAEAGSAPRAADVGLRDPEAASADDIRKLIEDLGNPRYTVRRAAANDLRQIGAEAFDLLHAATSHSDPEVAASARYLLRQITVRWVRSDDSPNVRRLLLDYGDKTDEARLVRVAQLAKLDNGEGLSGLCRIARFDRSPVISREAALAVIRPEDDAAARPPVDVDAMDHELGRSTRVAAIWLRQFLNQLQDPGKAVAKWQPIIDDEQTRLEQHADETSTEIVLGLLWNVADLHRQLDDMEAVTAQLERMIDLDEERLDRTAIELLSWIEKHKLWQVLDSFLEQHQSRLEQSKRAMYYVALARAGQGNEVLADGLAEKAAELAPQFPLDGFWMAKELEIRNRFDWAVREYRRAIDPEKIKSHEGILARIELANLLHDHEEYEQAADALEPLVKALRSDDEFSQLYTEIQRYHLRRRDLMLNESESLACRYHFYRALQHRDAEDWSRTRESLATAIKFDDTDADVVIAMYRVPEAGDKWRADTKKRIRDLCRRFEQEIQQSPKDFTPYNQWAWLVSNTEGDFQKAIRYSHRSIELIPPGAGDSAAASFLDTLGRCYFAAGDYENAVKYQRQAVEKIDYMQVMQRQLAQFETALAEQQAAESKSSP